MSPLGVLAMLGAAITGWALRDKVVADRERKIEDRAFSEGHLCGWVERGDDVEVQRLEAHRARSEAVKSAADARVDHPTTRDLFDQLEP